jgi:hypothetical protein
MKDGFEWRKKIRIVASTKWTNLIAVGNAHGSIQPSMATLKGSERNSHGSNSRQPFGARDFLHKEP